MFSLVGDLEELRALLLQRTDTTQLRLSAREDGNETTVCKLHLRRRSVVHELVDHLPDEHRLPLEDDEDLAGTDLDDEDGHLYDHELPEDEDDTDEGVTDATVVEDPDGPHDVPWATLVEALAEYIGELVREMPSSDGRVICRVRLYRGRKYLTCKTLKHYGTGPQPSMMSATAHDALQSSGHDGPAPPSEPTGFAGPYEPMTGDQFGKLLQAYAAANADLHQRLIWGTDMVISMLGRTSRLVTDQANQARASEQSVRQQERELRDNLSGIFQRMLTMRKEQLDGREADLKRQLADKRETERSQMLGKNIEKGIDAFAKVGKLYMMREHPELLGLDDEAMELMGTLSSNAKLRELTRHPKFAAMVSDPKFAETMQQMLQFLDNHPETADSAAS